MNGFRLLRTSALCLPLALACSASLAAAPLSSAESRAQRVLEEIPIVFEPNHGQWDSRVLFGSRAREHMLYLTRDTAVLQTTAGAVEMRLSGAQAPRAVEATDPAKSFSSYFIGRREDWRERVEHFRAVRYNEVYPGIDLIYYGKGSKLEHDFTIAPGADPAAIRMRFDGARDVRIGEAGSLRVGVGDAEIDFAAPIAYQRNPDGETTQVASRFAIAGDGEVGFEVGAYDRERELVIDPVLMYSTYFGGSGTEEANLVAVDAEGFIWICGQSTSEDFPTNGEGLQEGGGGAVNAFLTKLDPFAGPGLGLLYSSYFGGVQSERPYAMELDAAGNIYVAGVTRSGDFPTTSNAVQGSQPSQNENGFLVKFNLASTPYLKYGTYLGGDGRDVLFGLDVDAQGRAFVAGLSESSENLPLSSNTMQGSHRGGGDAIFAIIDTVGGGLVYSTYLGGTSTDWATGVAIGDEGTAYLTGWTASTDFPGNGNAYSLSQSGMGDAFLTQVNWTQPGLGALGYSTYFGGSDLDFAQTILRTSDGRFHLIGYTLSENFPTTAAAVQNVHSGNADIFVATLDPTQPLGEGLLYSTYVGGTNGDVPFQAVEDSTGGLVIAGYTLSSDFPATGDFYADSYRGLTDAFFLRVDPNVGDGQGLTCASYLGGGGSDVAWGLAVDGQDNLYLAGVTYSNDFPVTPNAWRGTRPGFASAFVSKFGPCASGGDDGSGEQPAGTRSISGRGAGRAAPGGGRGR